MSVDNSDLTPSKSIFHEMFAQSSTWGYAVAWRVHRNGHGWAIIPQRPSMSQLAQNKGEQMSRIKVTTNARATGCAAQLPLTNSEWSQLLLSSESWAEVRRRRLAVMWSFFVWRRCDGWTLSVVLKGVRTVTSQSSGAARTQQTHWYT